MAGWFKRNFKRLRDVNSTYSLADRPLQILNFFAPSMISTGLAGLLLARAQSFYRDWGDIGLVGAIILFGLVMTTWQIMAGTRFLRFAGADEGRVKAVSVEALEPAGGDFAQPKPPHSIARGYFDAAATPLGAGGGVVCTFVATLARASSSMIVYVEVNRGIRGYVLQKLRIAELGHVQQGESIRIPVVSASRPAPDRRMGFRAVWGEQEREAHGLTHLLVTQRERARLLFVYDNNLVESRYFVLDWQRGDAPDERHVIILDEGTFGFIPEWEAASN